MGTIRVGLSFPMKPDGGAGATGSRVCVSLCPGINLSFILRFAASCDSDGCVCGGAANILCSGSRTGWEGRHFDLPKEGSLLLLPDPRVDTPKHRQGEAHLSCWSVHVSHAYSPAFGHPACCWGSHVACSIISHELTAEHQPPAPRPPEDSPTPDTNHGFALEILVPSGK